MFPKSTMCQMSKVFIQNYAYIHVLSHRGQIFALITVCSCNNLSSSFIRLVYYNGTIPLVCKRGEKYVPGSRKKLLLESHHCDDNTYFCRMCITSHTKEDPCRMRFKKLQSESTKSKLCFVSYAIMSNDFKENCYVCYKSNKICPSHHGLRQLSSDDMCNALTTFRDVSNLLLLTDI